MSRRKLFLRRHSNSQKLLLDHRLWNLGNEIDDIKFQPAIIALKNNARPIGLDVPKGIDRVNFCHPFRGATRSSCSASCSIARSS